MAYLDNMLGHLRDLQACSPCHIDDDCVYLSILREWQEAGFSGINPASTAALLAVMFWQPEHLACLGKHVPHNSWSNSFKQLRLHVSGLGPEAAIITVSCQEKSTRVVM